MLGWLLGAAGAVELVAVFAAMVRLNRTRRWPSAQGVITRADYEISDGLYLCRVGYRFELGGKPFVGDRLSLRKPVPLGVDECQAWMESHAVGSRRLVFYNPRDPSENTLSLEVDPWLAKTYAVGFGLGLVAIAFGLTLELGAGARV